MVEERILRQLSSDSDNLRQFLKRLGLNDTQVEAYIYLHILGPSTVLALSKAIGSGRSKLYPALETLEEKGLVAIHEKHYGTTYEALDHRSLEFLVHERETHALALREELTQVQRDLISLAGPITQGSRVIEYKGVDGLKQINFNLTKAEKKFRVFEVAHLDEHQGMPSSFVERHRRACFDKKITSFDLTNNKEWTFVETQYDPNHEFQRGCYVPAEIFEIKVETYIYNDCIAYLQYEAAEIFGVEIYNASLANQQKQLFDLVWAQGQEF